MDENTGTSKRAIQVRILPQSNLQKEIQQLQTRTVFVQIVSLPILNPVHLVPPVKFQVFCSCYAGKSNSVYDVEN